MNCGAWLLYALAFFNGTAVMVAEMTASRMMAPYLGTSYLIWTVLITTVLCALALGAFVGGLLADRIESFQLKRTLLALLCAFAGLFTLLSALFYKDLGELVTTHFESLEVATFLLTLLLLVPNGFCFGMIAPYTVRFCLSGLQHAGRTVGIFSALNTLGSILGTLLGGIILISYFSLSEIGCACAAGMFLFAIVILLLSRPKLPIVLGILLFFFGVSLILLFFKNDEEPWIFESPYQTLMVYEQDDDVFIELDTPSTMRFLATDPLARQTAMSLVDTEALLLPYSRYAMLAPLLNTHLRDALVLGGGAYAMPRYYFSKRSGVAPDFHLDVVELDPMMTVLTERFFEMPKTDSMRVFHADARTFLRNSKHRYEFIFSDIHAANCSIPFHLATLENFESLSEHLTDTGFLIFNLVSPLSAYKGRLARAVYNGMTPYFEKVIPFRVLSEIDPDVSQGILFIAFKKMTPKILENIDALQAIDWAHDMWIRAYTLEMPEYIPPLRDNYAPIERYWLNFDRR